MTNGSRDCTAKAELRHGWARWHYDSQALITNCARLGDFLLHATRRPPAQAARWGLLGTSHSESHGRRIGTNGHVRPWHSKPRPTDLTPVLRRPVEPAIANCGWSCYAASPSRPRNCSA